jgi:hypothetical protein
MKIVRALDPPSVPRLTSKTDQYETLQVGGFDWLRAKSTRRRGEDFSEILGSAYGE